jgi:histidyl-tRNA synthetase
VAEGLRRELSGRLDELCADCRRRFETNVLRVMDCKQEACRGVVADLPEADRFMSEESRRYLKDVLELLERLEVPVERNPRLVRGLDYYAHTVWEIVHPALGAQDALSGGGRYEIMLGGKRVPGVGFAMGLERVVAALRETGGAKKWTRKLPAVWIVSHGDEALEENLLLAETLRQRGLRCRMDLEGRSVKAQMRMANREGAERVVIRGGEELEKGVFLLKHMADGSQEELDMPGLIERLMALHRLA